MNIVKPKVPAECPVVDNFILLSKEYIDEGSDIFGVTIEGESFEDIDLYSVSIQGSVINNCKFDMSAKSRNL